MFRFFRVLSGFFCTLILLVFFLAGAAILGARYWMLPHIEQWRPEISRYLSSQFDLRIELGAMAADWKGLNPRVTLRDVTITSTSGRPLLALPHVNAELSWRSVIGFHPRFQYLEASGLEVSVRRDAEGGLRILGRTIDLASDNEDDGAGRLLRWLAQQQRIVLHDATLNWSDETRTGQVLTLNKVGLAFSGQGDEYRFALTATPPAELGRALELRGIFGAPEASRTADDASGRHAEHAYERAASWLSYRLAPGQPRQPGATSAGNGALYIHIDEMHTPAWTPWMDLPTGLVSGRASTRSRIDFTGGHPQTFTSDVRVENGVWHYAAPMPAHGDMVSEDGLLEFRADAMQLYLHGSLDAYRRMLAAGGTPATPAFAVDVPAEASLARMTAPSDVAYRLIAHGVQVKAQKIMPRPILVDGLALKGALSMPLDKGLQVSADMARLRNSDVDATLRGVWRQGGSSAAGVVDAQGHVHRARVAAIGDYLPLVVDEDVRDWMAHGLLDGEIHDASVLLKGDLIRFPFGNDQAAFGDFQVEGPYRGAVIDYLPPEQGAAGWPALTDMQGTASLRRTTLQVIADSARVQPAQGKWVSLAKVRAQIPDLEHAPVLSVEGQTRGGSDAYLALMTHSPLGGLLDHVFDEASADGDWQVPLSLTVPLTHGADTTVRGEVHFGGGSLRLMPGAPDFRSVRGVLAFTESGAQARGLQGEFLGGAMRLDGGIGPTQKGLRMRGSVHADALARYAGVASLNERLHGQAPYDAIFSLQSGKGYTVTVSSSLEGMAVDLPPPLGKLAPAKRTLRADWRYADGSEGAMLDISLGEGIKALLAHRGKDGRDAGKGDGAVFYAGALGINQPPVLPAAGMRVDARYPDVDLDAWNDIRQALAGTSGGGALFPPLERFRLQTEKARVRGVELDTLTFTAQQPTPETWRVDISSTQTAGSLSWRYAGDNIVGPVEASFDRLAIGQPPGKDQKAIDAVLKEDGRGSDESVADGSDATDDDFDVPGINLYVRNLILYGHPAGELTLAGTRQEHGRLWRLDQLSLSTPEARLEGKGMWRLTGPERGLAIEADAFVEDMGAYLRHARFNDLMVGGSGQLSAALQWRNLPWAFNRADLSGQVTLDLRRGRFSGVNSASARLLELLSLQSLKRLARLDVNPASVAGEGFPFDTLKGTLTVDQGVLHTRDYRVVGPAGTVVLEGMANLVSKSLDMQAAVVPNLDVSGAAIAAGIAVNPIVGVGAFLTQLLLQTPLEKAMAAQYTITGDLGDPVISEVATPASERRVSGHPEPEH